jgi:hypothetical protein
MNCAEFQTWLQDRFDGVPGDQTPAAQLHLAACPECRAWQTAAERLEAGISLLRSENPSALLTDRIVIQVLADRRDRLRRLRIRRVAGALAASIAVATLAFAYVPRWLSKDNHQTIEQAFVVKPDEPKLNGPSFASSRDSMAEAGLAVASLSNRAKEETLKQTRMLFPIAQATLPFDKMSVPPSFDASAEPLSEAGKGVSEGLKPVANSARRAWDMFLREVPPIETSGKSNS